MTGTKASSAALADRRLQVIIWPTVLLAALFSILPTFLAAALAFTDIELSADIVFKFIGIRNFQDALENSAFINSFFIGWVWALSVTILSMALGLTLALVIHFSGRLGGTLRFFALFPWALSPVIVAILWRIVFDPYSGPVNALAKIFASPLAEKNFLGDFDLAFPTVVLIGAWLSLPVITISYLAALKGIPREMIEAAQMDGAGLFSIIRMILIPQLVAVTTALTSLNLIWNFNSFGLVYVLTNGGPGGKTYLPSLFVYDEAFRYGNFGFASALGILITVTLLMVLLAFTAFRSRLERQL
ncbi:MAG: hypothetical protein RLY84_403 [Actinomycetota bacterium]|jgi:multiple sugar transport system permease protein